MGIGHATLQIIITWNNDICRKDIFTVSEDSDPQIEELSVDEILNGIPGSDYQVKYKHHAIHFQHKTPIFLINESQNVFYHFEL